MPLIPLTSAHLRGAAASVLISAVFALAWGLNGSLALAGGWRPLALLLVAGVTVALIWLALKFHREAARAPVAPGPAQPSPFLTAAYRVCVIAMLVAFPVAARILTANRLEDAIMPATVVIVGLHFLGLVPAFRSGAFAWVTGAFCLLGVSSLLLPLGLRPAVLGLGCAVILWLCVMPLALQLLESLRQARAPA